MHQVPYTSLHLTGPTTTGGTYHVTLWQFATPLELLYLTDDGQMTFLLFGNLQPLFELLNCWTYSQTIFLLFGNLWPVFELSHYWMYSQAIFLLFGNLQPLLSCWTIGMYSQMIFLLLATFSPLLSCQTNGHTVRWHFPCQQLVTQTTFSWVAKLTDVQPGNFLSNLQPSLCIANFCTYGQTVFPLPSTHNLLSFQTSVYTARQDFLCWQLATAYWVAKLLDTQSDNIYPLWRFANPFELPSQILIWQECSRCWHFQALHPPLQFDRILNWWVLAVHYSWRLQQVSSWSWLYCCQFISHHP